MSNMRYSVKTRYAFRAFSNKKQAIQAARQELNDGWPSYVRDMVSGQIVFGQQ